MSDGGGSETLISDADPAGDTCSSKSKNVSMKGTNIGNLLNDAGVSWGFFAGGFDLSTTNSGPGGNGMSGCSRSTTSTVTGVTEADYIPHHQPFQYYASTQPTWLTRDPHRCPTIGHARWPRNHQYDIHDFFDAVNAGNFPAVTYLKAPGYQDGHAGY